MIYLSVFRGFATKVLNEYYTLSNGVKMPKIGFCTWKIQPGNEAYQSVTLALKHGYRHIGTAKDYQDRVFN